MITKLTKLIKGSNRISYFRYSEWTGAKSEDGNIKFDTDFGSFYVTVWKARKNGLSHVVVYDADKDDVAWSKPLYDNKKANADELLDFIRNLEEEQEERLRKEREERQKKEEEKRKCKHQELRAVFEQLFGANPTIEGLLQRFNEAENPKYNDECFIMMDVGHPHTLALIADFDGSVEVHLMNDGVMPDEVTMMMRMDEAPRSIIDGIEEVYTLIRDKEESERKKAMRALKKKLAEEHADAVKRLNKALGNDDV